MSRGVVLWPDLHTTTLIRTLWDEIARHGVPSMATHSHRLHEPHVSLIVAESLPVDAALEVVGPVPSRPIQLLIEAAGVFPGGFLFLTCAGSRELLDEHHRVHELIRPQAVEPWPYFTPGEWHPHITTGWALTYEQLAKALPIVLDHLPIHGWLAHGGVEDGTTGEQWPSATGSPRTANRGSATSAEPS
jgi:hypothetical protein